MHFPVSPGKESELLERLARLGIREEDLLERFVRSSGPGGQHVNKTSTAVYLKHLPTGIEVKAQATRSQAMNRFYARRLLAEKLEEIRDGKTSAEQQRIFKLRKRKRQRSRRAKEKTLRFKHHTAEKKRERATRPKGEGEE